MRKEKEATGEIPTDKTNVALKFIEVLSQEEAEMTKEGKIEDQVKSLEEKEKMTENLEVKDAL
jgi:hypothetical protein